MHGLSEIKAMNGHHPHARDLDISVHREAGAFVLETPHGQSLVAYLDKGGNRVFFHTETPPEDRGQGYAARVVKEALRLTHLDDKHPVAACPYVVAYLRKHPEEG
jgi:predicted GNAT family acetyltransferase